MDREVLVGKYNISVMDYIMGSGKTTKAFELMRNDWSNTYDQIIYISPNLSEVGGDKRVLQEDGTTKTETIVGRIQKEAGELDWVQPKLVKGSKTTHVRELLADGVNISATHALFTNLNNKDLELIQTNNNMLVIDEALNVVSELKGFGKADIRLLLNNDTLIVGDDKRVTWNHSKFHVTEGEAFKYNSLISEADTGNLYLFGSVDNPLLLIWEFPINLLAAFDKVVIITYLFEGSMMSKWLRSHGVMYTYMDVELNKSETELKAQAKKLLNIASMPLVDSRIGKLNLTQEGYRSMSAASRVLLKLGCENFIKNKAKAKTADILLTCPLGKGRKFSNQLEVRVMPVLIG